MCDYLYDDNKCIIKGECYKKDTCPIEEDAEKQKKFLDEYFKDIKKLTNRVLYELRLTGF